MTKKTKKERKGKGNRKCELKKKKKKKIGGLRRKIYERTLISTQERRGWWKKVK